MLEQIAAHPFAAVFVGIFIFFGLVTIDNMWGNLMRGLVLRKTPTPPGADLLRKLVEQHNNKVTAAKQGERNEAPKDDTRKDH